MSIKKYVFEVNAEVEIEAEDEEEAREKFWEDEVGDQPQQMACDWIDSHLTIRIIK